MRAVLFTLLAALFYSGTPASGTFISSGGFPAGTLVSATSGDINIEEVQAGDRILAISQDDSLVQSEVRDLYNKRALLYTITTERGKVVCTPYQQLLTWRGFIEAAKIKADDELAYLKNGRKAWTKIIRLKAGKVGKVYNLETAPPQTYIANGYFAHI